MKKDLLFSLLVMAGICTLSLSSCQEQKPESISLAGEWAFAIDPEDKGTSEQWFTTQTLTDKINLPGSLQEQGYGEDVSINTRWTGQIVDSSWYHAPEYAPYRKEGNIKVPFWLNPEKWYVGVAWYGRKVVIPEGWENIPVLLELERAHWFTEVYLDGQKVGECQTLQTPHRYELQGLTPGEHTLAIKVDNRLRVNVGYNAHSVSDHTQSNWNGLIGQLTLTAKPVVYIDYLRTDPDIREKQVVVTTHLKGRVPEEGAILYLQAVTPVGKKVGEPVSVKLEPGRENPVYTATIDLGPDAKLWSEFTPDYYKLQAKVEAAGKTDYRESNFGLREFKSVGTRFEINGKQIFLRGTLECCIFPQTGYPSMDPAYWEKIYKTCKEYGLNHVRFHSWCPPEVAFDVADRQGMYLQVECGVWTEVGSGFPQDKWIREESERILREYGNHPSFCLMAHGNEPSGERQVEYLTDLVAHWKEIDNRRVYTSASGWPFVQTADYCDEMAPRIQVWGAGLSSIINAQSPRTDYDFASIIHKDRPTVSHEVGQWCVYPNFREISKYTGVLKAKNMEIFQETLQQKGMGDLSDEFLYASGRLQTLCYKADIEAALRTPGFAGFQLLDLHDFPGQGTALVGVLDAFWDSKGYVDGAEYSTFCNSTVPLARFPKMVWKNNETMDVPLEVAHFGETPIQDAVVRWSIVREDGSVIGRGDKTLELPIGNCIPAGRIHCDLSQIDSPSQLTVSAEIEGTSFHNQWHVWVYPETLDELDKPIYVTEKLDSQAESVLSQGGSVLLLAYGKVPEDKGGDISVGFSSIFWNTAWTHGQPPHTLGIYCEKNHPALQAFPNEGVSDYQWWDIVSRCDAMVLDDYPEGFEPVVYLIDDWFKNRKLGLLYEARVGKGKLMVCSADLNSDLENRPAAAQFRHSLLQYMSSDRFNPAQELTADCLFQHLSIK